MLRADQSLFGAGLPFQGLLSPVAKGNMVSMEQSVALVDLCEPSFGVVSLLFGALVLGPTAGST